MCLWRHCTRNYNGTIPAPDVTNPATTIPVTAYCHRYTQISCLLLHHTTHCKLPFPMFIFWLCATDRRLSMFFLAIFPFSPYVSYVLFDALYVAYVPFGPYIAATSTVVTLYYNQLVRTIALCHTVHCSLSS